MAYTKKQLAEIKANIILNLVQNVDEINDVNIGSIMDILSTSIAQELEEQYNDLDVIYDGTRITTATGDDLEEIGEIVGVARNEGIKTTGHVTYARNTPTATDFVITNGTIVSSQPNTDLEQYKFVVTTDTTFKAEILTEDHLFVDGIFQYKADERLISSISEITGLVSSAAHTFVDATDYSVTSGFDDVLIKLKDDDEVLIYSLVDDCDATTGWTAGDEADAITSNTSVFYQGTGSLNLLKSGTTSNLLSYTKTLSSVTNISSVKTFTSIYIKDQTALDKITKIDLWTGSSSGIVNSYQYEMLNSALSIGWNRLILNKNDSVTDTNGNPDEININYLKIKITTTATTNTFVAGDLLMDFWFNADYENYVGDIIQWDKSATLPDTSTDFDATYIPLSVEVPIESEAIGSAYNLTTGKIIYQVTINPFTDRIYNYDILSGGTDVEDDTDYRDRVQNATFLKTNATVQAITYNVLDLDFIDSVNIIDMPEYSVTAESQIYTTGISKYTLAQEVAQDNSNLTIGDTVGATDYTKNTDYILTAWTNEIEWIGTTPVNGATYYVAYDYENLGHIQVYVVGLAGKLTASQLAEVQTVVYETRSAGVMADVVEPTYISTATTLRLDSDSNYVRSTVEEEVETAIQLYINDLSVGSDVFISGVINVAMDVTGVNNISISDLGGGTVDVAIAADEKAEAGTVTIDAW